MKKTLRAAEQDRPDILQQRSNWHLWQAHCDPTRLVFLDETGVNTKMARLYGRAQGGRRCLDAVPHGHWKSNTFIAALRYDRIEAPWMFEGAMNAVAFLTYLRKCLLPTLKHGDIVICDNLSSHKVAGVAEILAEAGAEIRYLPPYSPDLNPIEMFFAQLKALLRKAATRTLQTLTDATAQILQHSSGQLCQNLFKHAKYAPE